jgi:hypothetical protein
MRVIRNWGVSHSHLKGPAPIKGIKLPKGKEQMPFQTWDEIQAIIDRGGRRGSRRNFGTAWS